MLYFLMDIEMLCLAIRFAFEVILSLFFVYKVQISFPYYVFWSSKEYLQNSYNVVYHFVHATEPLPLLELLRPFLLLTNRYFFLFWQCMRMLSIWIVWYATQAVWMYLLQDVHDLGFMHAKYFPLTPNTHIEFCYCWCWCCFTAIIYYIKLPTISQFHFHFSSQNKILPMSRLLGVFCILLLPVLFLLFSSFVVVVVVHSLSDTSTLLWNFSDLLQLLLLIRNSVVASRSTYNVILFTWIYYVDPLQFLVCTRTLTREYEMEMEWDGKYSQLMLKRILQT